MKEYIVPIDNDSSNYDELFVGYIRENAQEIVRCGECWKRNKEDYCPLVSDSCYPPNLPDDWFCADGKRRADDEAD